MDAYVYNGTNINGHISGNYYNAGTLGFCAKDLSTGQYGVVTNAHVAESGKSVYSSNLQLYGTPSKWQLSGKLDAAFIPYSNQGNWGSTDRLLTGTGAIIRRVARSSEYYLGRKIYMYGKTSGRQYGYIKDMSTEIQPSSVNSKITDIIRYDITRAGGDSGAPLGIENTSDKVRLIGIHFAGEGNTGYGIRIENILSTYNLEAFTQYRVGDVNIDQKVDTTDARLVLSEAVANPKTFTMEENALADVDFNGVVDTTDARIILQRAS